MSSLFVTIGVIVGLLALAVIVAMLADRARLPAEVALVAFGAVVALVHPMEPPFGFADAMLLVFLPPLIFEAAWSLDLEMLARTAWRSMLLAFPGTVFVAAGIASAVALVGHLPWTLAWVLGAIVAPTDPVAVVAVFRRIPIPTALQTIIEVESIANDGVAIALFGLAIAAASQQTISVGMAALHAIVAIVAGCAIGIVCALVTGAFLRLRVERGLMLAATVVLAFGSYLVATALGASGVFATAAAGITLRAVAAPRIGNGVREIDSVWSALAFIANSLVFLLTGLQLRVTSFEHAAMLMLVTIGAVLATRLVLAATVVRPFAWSVVTALAGMRGGLSLALALALPRDLPAREQIFEVVCAVVAVTLVGQGLALAPTLRALRGRAGIGVAQR